MKKLSIIIVGFCLFFASTAVAGDTENVFCSQKNETTHCLTLETHNFSRFFALMNNVLFCPSQNIDSQLGFSGEAFYTAHPEAVMESLGSWYQVGDGLIVFPDIESIGILKDENIDIYSKLMSFKQEAAR